MYWLTTTIAGAYRFYLILLYRHGVDENQSLDWSSLVLAECKSGKFKTVLTLPTRLKNIFRKQMPLTGRSR
jgi:hypothetical protein